MKICGIYKITNIKNGHMYIGASIDCHRRWLDHRSKSHTSTKSEDINKILYRAMRKYGLDNFIFEIIEQCKPEELKDREIYWIDYYNTFHDKRHYNRDPGGNLSCESKILRGEKSPLATLTNEDVTFCRELYRNGENRPIKVWKEYFSDKIGYSGFVKMFTGQTWSHIMPEVFEERKGNRRFSYEDALKFKAEFLDSNLSLNQFAKTKKGYVGYGTLWRMINDTESYKK